LLGKAQVYCLSLIDKNVLISPSDTARKQF
jgi:hypothetical protein